MLSYLDAFYHLLKAQGVLTAASAQTQVQQGVIGGNNRSPVTLWRGWGVSTPLSLHSLCAAPSGYLYVPPHPCLLDSTVVVSRYKTRPRRNFQCWGTLRKEVDGMSLGHSLRIWVSEVPLHL